MSKYFPRLRPETIKHPAGDPAGGKRGQKKPDLKSLQDDPDLHETDRQEMSRFHFSLKDGADDRRVGGVVLYNIFHGNDNN